MAQNALLSVYDKTGIAEFARGLEELGWTIYASGGTYKTIIEAGVTAHDVADLVGGSAILGHKVVTLSREIGAGLLADLNNSEEMSEMAAENLPVIHLVCQDSYPLEATIAEGGSRDDVLQQSDIGGPTMLREAAKGRRIVLSVPEQRAQVLDWLRAGKPNEKEFVDQLAARATYEVARYTMIEAKYWGGDEVAGFIGRQIAPTKYGENPQQKFAALYADNRIDIDPLGQDQFEYVQGMERGFVGVTDLDRSLQTLAHIAAGFDVNFGTVPFIAAGVKHGNTCGAAVAKMPNDAIKKMLDGDLRAIFGGVVMVNFALDETTATTLLRYGMDSEQNRLLDGVICAGADDKALELLSRKKLRVITNPALAILSRDSLETARRFRPIRGGMLVQDNYDFVQELTAEHMTCYGEISEQQKRDMILAWAVGATSNSNTITLVKNGQLIGNGVGQQDRVGAGQLALSRTTTTTPSLQKNDQTLTLIISLDAAKLAGSVAYSDSFFPFPDGPELLAQAGVRAILTSSGSVGDKAVIKTLTDAGVSVMMVPDKIGRGFFQH